MEQPSKTEHFPTQPLAPRQPPQTPMHRDTGTYTQLWLQVAKAKPGGKPVLDSLFLWLWLQPHHRLTLLCQKREQEFLSIAKTFDFAFKKITSQRIKISNQIEIHNNTKMTKVRIIWHRFLKQPSLKHFKEQLRNVWKKKKKKDIESLRKRNRRHKGDPTGNIILGL